MLKTFAIGYLVLLTAMSLATFVMYGWDKRQARNDGWRVPEVRLHVAAFLGGWPGAFAGQNYFRHKTQKLSFKLLTWSALLLHSLVTVVILYVATR